MVTSGIFLISRSNVLFSLAPETMAVVAGIGLATALIAGTMGITANDIKKVLAYSTVSQLGFMFVALGVGAYTTGVFHVMTHAFFKALMFLGAGSVIHGMHHEQDIKRMGGLKKHMPVTHFTFLIGVLAIAGIPFFSGFFSKDEILWFTFLNGGPVMWGLLALGAFITAFYMWRLYTLTFLGEERFDHHHVHPHESPKSMTMPLVILAVLSALGGLLGVPHVIGHALHIPNLLEEWLHPVMAQSTMILPQHTGDHASTEIMLMVTSVIIALTGIFLARGLYAKGLAKATSLASGAKGVYKLLWNKYWVDEAYFALIVDPIMATSRDFLWKVVDVRVIDGLVNGSARSVNAVSGVLRRLQSGVAQNYAILMMAGIVVIVALALLPMLR
jgi:NADH-quinone oxidoreductase subunit L